MSGFSGIGICSKNAITNKCDLYSLGHNYFMISSKGIVWNSVKSELNNSK